MEQNNQFIPNQAKEENGVDELFRWLGDELWPDGEATAKGEWNKKHPIQWASLWFTILFQVLALGTVVFSADAYLRNREDVSFFAELPVCEYFSMGIDNFDNIGCKTYPQIVTKFQEDKIELEKKMWPALAILIPRKIQVSNVLGNPDIQFIEQHTGDNRIIINEMIEEFNTFRKSLGSFEGEDIDCKSFKVTEKWDLEVMCDFLGSWILSGDAKSKTSRQIALEFLDKIGAEGSKFKLSEKPKSLSLDSYVSTDLWLRGTFSTKTTIPLKLKYYPVSKL
jgi:hypothetical protein